MEMSIRATREKDMALYGALQGNHRLAPHGRLIFGKTRARFIGRLTENAYRILRRAFCTEMSISR